MASVRLIAVTKPAIDGIESAGGLISYAACVSNPGNQMNMETSPKLLDYLKRNSHWSPFEMASMTVEIKTTRAIARQILRHRSFSFQEFSQRYAVADLEMVESEVRTQDNKNRQNSHEVDDKDLQETWAAYQEFVWVNAKAAYTKAIEQGIAKEVARNLLPEGLTPSTIYMAGTFRSFIHYCDLRTEAGTQKEHREIAEKIKLIVQDQLK
jgi:thymidylate synthase (FAD)